MRLCSPCCICHMRMASPQRQLVKSHLFRIPLHAAAIPTVSSAKGFKDKSCFTSSPISCGSASTEDSIVGSPLCIFQVENSQRRCRGRSGMLMYCDLSLTFARSKCSNVLAGCRRCLRIINIGRSYLYVPRFHTDS